MTDNKKKIMDNLEQARSLLLSALILLDDENKDGKQFDYCTSPRLSEVFDPVSRTVKSINEIIYQGQFK